jgi:hypothetical protein
LEIQLAGAQLGEPVTFSRPGIFLGYTRRGHVDVLDRIGLQSRACECCAVVKNEMDRLLPRSANSD